MKNWYVIQTKPKKEEEADSYLSTRGVEIFSPLVETFTARNAKLAKELKPLFPGYIFGKFDLEQNYPLVRWGRGLRKFWGLEDILHLFLKKWSRSLKREPIPRGL